MITVEVNMETTNLRVTMVEVAVVEETGDVETGEMIVQVTTQGEEGEDPEVEAQIVDISPDPDTRISANFRYCMRTRGADLFLNSGRKHKIVPGVLFIQ
jgi:Ca2+-binding EF-hand superfamily protein